MLHQTLKQWEVFCAIADAGSTTAAAERVGLSQSAISASLQQLEQGMGAQVFDRIGKRLALNDLGRSLLPQAQALLEQAGALERLGQPGSAAAPVALRLAASTTIANHVLAPILAAFMRSHANVHITLDIGNTREVAEAMHQGRVDLGFIEGLSHWPDLELLPWRRDELSIVCAAGDPLEAQARSKPLSIAQLRACRWLLREEGSGTRETVEAAVLSKLGSWQIAAVLGSSEAICAAVAQGAGLACVSQVIVQPMVARGELAILPTCLPSPNRQFSMLQRKGKKRSAMLQALVDACQTG